MAVDPVLAELLSSGHFPGIREMSRELTLRPYSHIAISGH
jgi:hypothetical protein